MQSNASFSSESEALNLEILKQAILSTGLSRTPFYAVATLWQCSGAHISQTVKWCEAQSSCSCRRSEELRCLADRVLAHKAPTYGDFADAWTSPNDPIFFFHHANVDRHLMTWQQKNTAKAPHFGFLQPSIPCKGHGLEDVVGAAHPFDGSLLGLDSGPLTNADVLAADGLHLGPYTYDTLVKHTSLRTQRKPVDWLQAGESISAAVASAIRHMSAK